MPGGRSFDQSAWVGGGGGERDCGGGGVRGEGVGSGRLGEGRVGGAGGGENTLNKHPYSPNTVIPKTSDISTEKGSSSPRHRNG